MEHHWVFVYANTFENNKKRVKRCTSYAVRVNTASFFFLHLHFPHFLLKAFRFVFYISYVIYFRLLRYLYKSYVNQYYTIACRIINDTLRTLTLVQLYTIVSFFLNSSVLNYPFSFQI